MGPTGLTQTILYGLDESVLCALARHPRSPSWLYGLSSWLRRGDTAPVGFV
jgi:hypothetical protein